MKIKKYEMKGLSSLHKYFVKMTNNSNTNV